MPLQAFVSGLNKICFLRSRCSMEMWCPDDTGRESWDFVGPPAWVRARFNSPEWRLLACLKRSLPDCIIVAVVDVVACAVAKRNDRQEVPVVKMIFLCENSFFLVPRRTRGLGVAHLGVTSVLIFSFCLSKVFHCQHQCQSLTVDVSSEIFKTL